MIFRGWKSSGSVRSPEQGGIPDRVLVIRLHAIGDVAITFPMCASLRHQFPNTRIDFLTSETIAPLPAALTTFDSILSLPVCTTRAQRIHQVTKNIPSLRKRQYQLIIDLQTNWVSKSLRIALRPEAWGEFDRVSPRAASDRVRETFLRLGFSDLVPDHNLQVREDLQHRARELLESKGFTAGTRLILLNPAGLWNTRSWPMESYINIAQLFLRSGQFRFLLLGTPRITEKAAWIERTLAKSVVNLVGETTLGEAMAILQHVSLSITEDSGLMHMAWASGIPTIALFGSTRHDWSSPVGPHARVFHSGDLPCGDCMEEVCRYGDVHCLTRITPEIVHDHAMELLNLHSRQTAE